MSRTQVMGPKCQLCGATMVKKVQSSGNCLGLLVALLVLFLGLLVTVFIPVLGWVIGPIIMLIALFIGGKKSKVWRCTSCRSIMPRA